MNSLHLDLYSVDERGVSPFIGQITLSKWYHVAATWKGTLNSACVDGILVAQDAPSAIPDTNINDTASVCVGLCYNVSPFEGKFAGFTIFD